jgi:hypothetical protein
MTRPHPLRSIALRVGAVASVTLLSLALAGVAMGRGEQRAAPPTASSSAAGLEPSAATAVAVAQALAAHGGDVRVVVACVPPAPAPSDHPRVPSAAFDDGRVGSGDRRYVVREGGVVEVLPDRSGARDRVAELDRQLLAAQEYGFDEGGRELHAERRLLRGSVLLRLSGDLSRAEVATYRRALHAVVPPGRSPDLIPTTPAEEAPCST